MYSKNAFFCAVCLFLAVSVYARNDGSSISGSRPETAAEAETTVTQEFAAPQDTTYRDFDTDTLAAAVKIGDYIKHRGTTSIVTVKGNPEAIGKSTLQFMQVIPGLNGGLYVYGKKDPATVYVNGRELKMSTDNLRQYLSSLKAEDVRQIQVMPNHGVKHAGDTKGGIIKIQLRSKEERQYSGTVAVPVGLNEYDAAIKTDPAFTFNYMSKKLSSYSYVSGGWLQNEHIDFNYTFGDEEEGQIHNEESSDRGFYTLNLDQSLIWNVADNHELGFAVNGFAKPRELDNMTSLYSVLKENTAVYYGGGTITYNWEYGDNGSTLGFTGDYLFRQDKNKEDYLPTDDDAEHTNTKTNKNTWSLKVDGDHFFNDDISDLSYGAFYLGMNADQKYSWQGERDRFRFNEKTYGGYVEFCTAFFDEVLELDAGVRYEGYRADWTYENPLLTDRTNGKNSINSFFPSVGLSYESDNGVSYTSLEYSRDIDRPVMGQYDPTVYRESDNFFTVGAPTLKPQFENTISLTETIKNKHTFMLSYSWIKDIYDVVFHQEGENIYASEDNIGSSRKLELYADTRFWIVNKWLYAHFSADVDYTRYVHSDYGKLNTWNAFFSGVLTLYLPKSWTVGAWASYMTPTTIPTQWSSDNWSLNANVEKKFGDKFSLTLTARNLVYNSNNRAKSRVSDVSFDCLSKFNFRTYSLRFVYKFGSTNLNSVKCARGNYEVRSRSAGK